ncbi:hypothetical protein [Streptosporangium sp. NBC_01756]|uniref:hypothetical protein n=1 Tax=Streptosporangium sp. NBC_01756 TaxID=2975950 RepID=UPI002DD86512|nr:hypothetical protein [Streptosporangium sp. NBC_01756]WSC87671.1 hypothetical protein OIE48_05520 [Streptosporangium sp. NBC_01756]
MDFAAHISLAFINVSGDHQEQADRDHVQETLAAIRLCMAPVPSAHALSFMVGKFALPTVEPMVNQQSGPQYFSITTEAPAASEPGAGAVTTTAATRAFQRKTRP